MTFGQPSNPHTSGSHTAALASLARRTRHGLNGRTAVLVALALAISGARSARGQVVNLWGTDGPVYAVVRDGSTVYLGGSFTYVGPRTGGGALIDAGSGVVLPGFPQVTGVVSAIASDGSGGWYIGGQFTSVGGVARSNLAHVGPDLAVTAWNPRCRRMGHGPCGGRLDGVCRRLVSLDRRPSRRGIAALDAETPPSLP